MQPQTILKLEDFDISPERGFLPKENPKTPLTSHDIFGSYHHAAQELPDLLTADGALTDRILRLPKNYYDTDWKLDDASQHNVMPHILRWRMRTLSFLGHAWIWENPKKPRHNIVRQIAVPWYEVSRLLGRPPVLSYASYALENWRRLNPDKPIELGNIALAQTFLGGQDEQWFILVHVDIEAKAARVLRGIVTALNGVSYGDYPNVLHGLWEIACGLEQMYKTLERMTERCDPYIYYNRVRPYIHGWKDNPALPDGVLYEGVKEYGGQPQKFRGETGAQSSILPAIDAALGIPHMPTNLTRYLEEMRLYMPPQHKRFIETIENMKDAKKRPLLYGYVVDQKRASTMKEPFCACIELVEKFRALHLGYAWSYINRQSERNVGNPVEKGTGGTPFIQYLEQHRQETEEILKEFA